MRERQRISYKKYMERQKPENSSSQEQLSPRLEIASKEISAIETVRRVNAAFKDAEGSADLHDSQAAEEEMLRNTREYGARAGVSKETLRSVDEEIGLVGKLAEIRKQEEGALARFRQKLQKLAGPLAGMAMMMPNAAGAGERVEAPSAYVQLEPERQPDIPDRGTESVVAGDSGNEVVLPNEFAPVGKDVEETKGEGKTAVVLGGEQETEALESRQRDAKYAFEQEFRDGTFSNEEEVLALLHKAAREFDNEFFSMYAIKPDGRVEIVSATFIGKYGGTLPDRNENMRMSRTKNQKILLAHTHPISSAESLDLEKSHEKAFQRMPPSLVDIRAASELSWLDRYDDPRASEGIERGGQISDPTEGVVVDGEGVWKYRVDFFHPYLQEQRKAAVEEAVKMNAVQQTISQERGGSAVDAERVRKYYAQIVIPDETIARRLLKDIPKNIQRDFASVSHARMAGTGSDEGFGYEYTNEQVKVGNAKPEEREKATEDFILWCRERGIEITFTPFEKKETE